jgi:hypothetical protein
MNILYANGVYFNTALTATLITALTEYDMNTKAASNGTTFDGKS